VPTHWPPGVLGPASGRFLRALAEANPQAVVTSGHTTGTGPGGSARSW
jgi:hypothetical protein